MNKVHKAILSSVIGNILENYDYILYANFALIISQTFFANSDGYFSLLATFAIFAIGFFMRPVGAIVFGYIGDKYSRKLSLSSSIILMSVSTAMIGILPSYDQIGILAPIILTIIRLLQGFSIGGETSGFITYLMESMPNTKRKSLLGSLAVSSTAIGLFFGFLASFICNFYFPSSQTAWRVTFLLSLPVGIIGIYIRSKMEDGLEFIDLKQRNLLSASPIKELFLHHKKRFLIICGIFASLSIQFYVFFGFLATFMVRFLNYDKTEISIIYLFSTLTFSVLAPLSGWFSDRYGIGKILIFSILLFVILVFPTFTLILKYDFVTALIGCIIYIALSTFYQGSIPSIVTHIFPTRIRSTGTALSFNITSALCGGLAPLILTYFFKVTQNHFVVAGYLVFWGIISAIAIVIGIRLKILKWN